MLIAQISDFHLKPEGVLAYGVADTTKPLKRAVDHINRLNPVPDLVMITGDLVDEGAPESYLLLRQLLSPLKPPFVIVPGNHDHKESLRKTFPEHNYLSCSIEEKDEAYICFALDDFPVHLIGLDTVTPGEHGGGFGPKRRAWLQRTLSARSGLPAIIFMHHPPFASAIRYMDKEEFRGWREFHALISEHPQVERVLCGHLHRPIFRHFGGTIATTCPAIGMQLCLDLREEAPSTFMMEPPSLMLHLWTDLWGEKTLLTHISVIEEYPGQYSGPHPFFGVVSPK
ncbi:MAG: phosphodiesterase [Deltaproteobacteria bacterium]|nr:phosphodiesterase [Deltaproteobacteria bacterium]